MEGQWSAEKLREGRRVNWEVAESGDSREAAEARWDGEAASQEIQPGREIEVEGRNTDKVEREIKPGGGDWGGGGVGVERNRAKVKGDGTSQGEKAGIRGSAGGGSWEMEAEMEVEKTARGDRLKRDWKSSKIKGAGAGVT